MAVNISPISALSRILGTLLMGATLCMSTGCKEKRELTEMPVYSGPLLTIRNVNTLMSDSAINRIHLEAPLQYEFKEGNREFPEGLHMDFMELDGHTSSTVDAQQGYYYKDKNVWKVTGNVILEGLDEGERLTTEELWWDPEKREVFTEENIKVTIRQGNNVMVGTGLWALQDFSEYTLSNIEAQSTIEDAEPTEQPE